MEIILSVLERGDVKVFLIVLLALIVKFIMNKVFKRLEKQLRKTKNLWDDALLEALAKPLNYLIVYVGIYFASQVLEDYIQSTYLGDDYSQSGLFSLINSSPKLVIILMSSVVIVRLINIIERNILKDFENTGKKISKSLDQTTLVALAKLFRLTVIISFALVALQTYNISIAGLLAFGGVGGIAIGFAAQDLLANFFGGMIIYLDRPFAIGDWIRSPDREIEGTVEHIGWRMTTVRTFDKRPLYIPNSVFSTIALENPSRMKNRRIYETIGIRYKDAAKVGAIVTDIKKMLQRHDEIDTGQTLIVNLNKYASSSLDIFIYTFTKTTDWVYFHEVKQDVLSKIIDIVLSHGADFAFPTTTLDGVDPRLLEARS